METGEDTSADDRAGTARNKKRKLPAVASGTTDDTTVNNNNNGPRPFWNADSAWWSDAMLPKADGMQTTRHTISACGTTWFDTHMSMQQTPPAVRCDWKPIVEPVLPPPAPPVSSVAVVKTKRHKEKAPHHGEGAKEVTRRPSKQQLPKAPAAKSKKIRIYPTAEQKRKLNRWMGAARWTYNQALDVIESNPYLVDFGTAEAPKKRRKTDSDRAGGERKEKGTATIESSSKFIRHRCVNKAAMARMQDETGRDLSWVTETPSFCRNQAVNEALMAYKTNAAKQQKQDRCYRFQVKHRSRLKDPTQCITFSSEDWGRSHGKCADLLSRDVMRACPSSRRCRTKEDNAIGHPYCYGKKPKGRTRYNLPERIRYDFKIVRIRATDKYFLCIPCPLEVYNHIPQHPDREPYRIIALDPGVRTFQTGFDQNGTAFEFGSVEDEKRILRLCQHLDALECRRQAKQPSDPSRFVLRHKKRAGMKRAAARMRDRIRDLVDELHRKTALFLCRNYNAVLIPEFQTPRMARRGEQRYIATKTARMMYTWGHFRFRQRLIHAAREHPQCRVVIVGEDYTSKTCGRCGEINRKLGGQKIYTCQDQQCGYRADRDVNAARNILLRYLTEHVRRIPKGSTDVVRCFPPWALSPPNPTEGWMHVA